MMEFEAGLYMLLWQGLYYDSRLTLGGSEHLQPTSPQCTFIHTHPAWYLQCTGQQWAGRRINGFTSMYKSVHTGTMKGRVIAITRTGI